MAQTIIVQHLGSKSASMSAQASRSRNAAGPNFDPDLSFLPNLVISQKAWEQQAPCYRSDLEAVAVQQVHQAFTARDQADKQGQDVPHTAYIRRTRDLPACHHMPCDDQAPQELQKHQKAHFLTAIFHSSLHNSKAKARLQAKAANAMHTESISRSRWITLLSF